MKLGVIGATGWLGAALGTRGLAAGLLAPSDLVALNRSGARGAYAAWPDVVWASDAAALCAQSDVVILAVRPEDFPLPGFQASGRLVVSFMVGWTLDRLQALAPEARIVRAMPNAASSVGQSFTPWVCGPGVSDSDKSAVRVLLSALGDSAEVADEGQLEYLSALSGSGAAYPALMAQAMLDHARRRGLPEDLAQRAVESVVAGSAALLRGQIGGVGAMLDTYRGYRGVTAAGLAAAEDAGFVRSIGAALEAAEAKALAMGQG